MNLNQLATIADQAALNSKAIPQLSLGHSFTEQEAYEIQKMSIQQRLNRGETLLGYKLGFTSRLKMQQMGVHDMIWGRLTSSMLLEEGAHMELDHFIHPRAEPEICFLIKKDITHPISLLQAVDYLEALAPAIEIIDSRYENFKFSLEDVVADNCSSAGVVLGKWRSPNQPIHNLGMILEINQKPVQIGSSAAILGDPMRSLVAAARLVLQNGGVINQGEIILAGAATPAVYVQRGDHIRARVEKLGSAGIMVK